MTNDTSLLLSTIDENEPNSNNIDDHSLTHENDPYITVSQEHEQKPSSPYLMLSVGDNQHFSLPDFKDPLFYQQPLHFHYNQSIPSMSRLGYDRGDRIQLTNEIKSTEYRKQKSLTSRKCQIEKKKLTRQRYVNNLKKNKIKKSKEKKKKASRGNMNIRKHKSKTNSQHHRCQSKSRHALILQRRHQQQMLSKKKKSITSIKRTRKSNTTNDRVPSTVSSRTTRTQSKTRPTAEIESNKIKHQTDESTSKHMMNNTERSTSLLTKPLTLSCAQLPLSSKISSSSKVARKISKKDLRQSKLNVRKASASKSKQIKPRSRGRTKLNIRTPLHTTLKKNIRCYKKRKTAGCKTKFPRITSKTLITTAPVQRIDENMIKSPSSFSLKNSLIDKQSSKSTLLPLAKNTAQLTSKNNNKHRPSNLISTISKRKLKKSTRREMTHRSRTIIITNNNAKKRK